MKLRVIFFCFTILTIITAASGLYFYYDIQKKDAFKEDRIVSISHAKAIENSILEMIARYRGITLSLSRQTALNHVLTEPTPKNIRHTHQILDIYNSSMQTSVCYLLNTDGVTIASSNRKDKDSFVGKNYAFRPYFKKAVQGKPAVYLALGVTSGRRGIYFSNPVYDETGKITGVAVIKEDFEKLEKIIITKHYPSHVKHKDLVFLTDENGVIFLADKPGKLYHTLWKAQNAEIERIAESRQFGRGPWPWAGFKQISQEKVTDSTGQTYFLIQKDIKELPGWQITHLSDADAILKGLLASLYETAGYVSIFIFLILGSALFILNFLAADAEKSLRNSEERYRSVTQTVNEGIILQAASGEILTWNRGAEDIFGIPAKAVIGKTSKASDWQTVHEDGSKYEGQDHPSMRTLKTGKPCRNEIMGVYRPSRELRWISVNTNPMFKENDKKPYAVAISFSDISEQKIAREKLKKSEERLTLALDSVSDAVWDWRVDTGEVYFSPRWYRMLGYEPYELPQEFETWQRLLHPNDLPDAEKIVNHHLENAKPFEIEFRMRTKDNQWRWVLARGKTVETDDQGKAVRMLGTHMDITDRKKMEKRLQQAQKMESIGSLAGGIAHDFNNILFPIIGMAELLLEDLPTGSMEHENVKEILKAGHRGSDLVKQILTFSRQSEHKKIPTRVQSVLKEVLQLSKSTIPSDIKIDPDIQQDCGLILADPTQIHQVAMNLITNAYHAVQADRGEISVRLEEKLLAPSDSTDPNLGPGRYVILSVSDTGAGIPPQFIDKIFDPYFTTKEKGKGTGLGLAVVHGIVQEYRGTIKVHSELGKGATFVVYLPAMDKQASFEPVKKAGAYPMGNERILLVDDEESIVNLEKQMLERLGYHVTGRSSSPDALNAFKARRNDFDLVITDMTMPNMTGDQLTGELKSIRPDIPVIICTGFSERLDAKKAKMSGIDGLLMKPVVQSELAEMVRKILDGAKSDQTRIE